jgi:hypothetical protein
MSLCPSPPLVAGILNQPRRNRVLVNRSLSVERCETGACLSIANGHLLCWAKAWDSTSASRSLYRECSEVEASGLVYAAGGLQITISNQRQTRRSSSTAAQSPGYAPATISAGGLCLG